MKFSELTTENAMDVFCEITEYVERIMNDEELVNELKKELSITDETTNVEKTAIVLSKIKTIAPILLKKRRDDVLGIVAAVNSMTVDEIKKQNIVKTLLQIREIIGDKDFMDFFKSFVSVAGGA
jgi:hypothetical protein